MSDDGFAYQDDIDMAYSDGYATAERLRDWSENVRAFLRSVSTTFPAQGSTWGDRARELLKELDTCDDSLSSSSPDTDHSSSP